MLDDYPIGELVEFIDWTPFFQTWELAGRYPEILQDSIVGETATSLYADAREMLDGDRAAKSGCRRVPCSVCSRRPPTGDDVLLYHRRRRDTVLTTLNFLRQQRPKAEGRANRCLADYVAPLDSGLADHAGLFAVTAGLGIQNETG